MPSRPSRSSVGSPRHSTSCMIWVMLVIRIRFGFGWHRRYANDTLRNDNHCLCASFKCLQLWLAARQWFVVFFFTSRFRIFACDCSQRAMNTCSIGMIEPLDNFPFEQVASACSCASNASCRLIQLILACGMSFFLAGAASSGCVMWIMGVSVCVLVHGQMEWQWKPNGNHHQN